MDCELKKKNDKSHRVLPELLLKVVVVAVGLYSIRQYPDPDAAYIGQ
jgi:hypothetical protein